MNVMCNWQMTDSTPIMAMAVLHGQTDNTMFAKQAVETARDTVIPNLLTYSRGGSVLLNETIPAHLRPRELLYINISSLESGVTTTGCFSIENYLEQLALYEILMVLFIIIVWLLGIVFFVGPVMILVSTDEYFGEALCCLFC